MKNGPISLNSDDLLPIDVKGLGLGDITQVRLGTVSNECIRTKCGDDETFTLKFYRWDEDNHELMHEITVQRGTPLVVDYFHEAGAYASTPYHFPQKPVSEVPDGYKTNWIKMAQFFGWVNCCPDPWDDNLYSTIPYFAWYTNPSVTVDYLFSDKFEYPDGFLVTGDMDFYCKWYPCPTSPPCPPCPNPYCDKCNCDGDCMYLVIYNICDIDPDDTDQPIGIHPIPSGTKAEDLDVILWAPKYQVVSGYVLYYKGFENKLESNEIVSGNIYAKPRKCNGVNLQIFDCDDNVLLDDFVEADKGSIDIIGVLLHYGITSWEEYFDDDLGDYFPDNFKPDGDYVIRCVLERND